LFLDAADFSLFGFNQVSNHEKREGANFTNAALSFLTKFVSFVSLVTFVFKTVR